MKKFRNKITPSVQVRGFLVYGFISSLVLNILFINQGRYLIAGIGGAFCLFAGFSFFEKKRSHLQVLSLFLVGLMHVFYAARISSLSLAEALWVGVSAAALIGISVSYTAVSVALDAGERGFKIPLIFAALCSLFAAYLINNALVLLFTLSLLGIFFFMFSSHRNRIFPGVYFIVASGLSAGGCFSAMVEGFFVQANALDPMSPQQTTVRALYTIISPLWVFLYFFVAVFVLAWFGYFFFLVMNERGKKGKVEE